MKTISTLLLIVGAGVALMGANVSPSAQMQEKQIAQNGHVEETYEQTGSLGSAIKVITPQKDLETAIRNSEYGDILLQGPDGWYRVERKALSQGTMVYVLGNQDSQITAFPKEPQGSNVR